MNVPITNIFYIPIIHDQVCSSHAKLDIIHNNQIILIFKVKYISDNFLK